MFPASPLLCMGKGTILCNRCACPDNCDSPHVIDMTVQELFSTDSCLSDAASPVLYKSLKSTDDVSTDFDLFTDFLTTD